MNILDQFYWIGKVVIEQKPKEVSSDGTSTGEDVEQITVGEKEQKSEESVDGMAVRVHMPFPQHWNS